MRERIPILCVDDEPAVLEGLRDSLRRHFHVHTAESGTEALELLRAEPDRFKLVISDMRMPALSGAQFLSEARRVAPHTVRMLLTGQSDMGSAIKAVNDGHIFRFLTKPCERDELLRACAAALNHHRVVSSQDDALDAMAQGTVAGLLDLLAVHAPDAHARATAAARYAGHLLPEDTPEDERWTLESAAALRFAGGADDTDTALRILARVPRLQPLRDLLTAALDDAATERPATAAKLALALAVEALLHAGTDREAAIEQLAGEGHDPGLLRVLDDGLHHDERASMRTVTPADLQPGMCLVDDLRTDAGGLLLNRGEKLTAEVLARLSTILSRQSTPIRVS